MAVPRSYDPRMDDTLFDLPPTGPSSSQPEGSGRPRVQRPDRDQIELRPSDLESLLPPDHRARPVGVGGARALERQCAEHDAYRWLCGGVSVNYHTLADFRVDHADVLDELLTRSVAALIVEGHVTLTRVAGAGMRVRASAGAASFRRRDPLAAALAEAETPSAQSASVPPSRRCPSSRPRSSGMGGRPRKRGPR